MRFIAKIFGFILILFAIAVTLHYTVKPHKYLVMSQEDKDSLTEEGLLSTKKILLPGFPKAYNPSLLHYKEGFLLTFRVDSYDVTSKVKHILNHKVSYLGLAKLDDAFNVIGKPQLLHIPYTIGHEISAAQDARLFDFQGAIYMLYNDYTDINEGSQQMFLAQLTETEEGVFLPQNPLQLYYPESAQRVEKNWSPFTFDGKLFVVYRMKPHTILEVDLASGQCRKVEENQQSWSWRFGENRGGTPCSKVGDQYLSFFHSSKKGVPTFFRKNGGRIFYMGAYLFEGKPPFAIKKISSQPIGRTEDYSVDNHEKILYPAGLVVAGDRIHISWGKNDRQIYISTFEKSALLKSLNSIE